VDYIKYVLKSNEELDTLLEGKDNLFVVGCGKCFKVFDGQQEEPDLGEFVKFAQEKGKTITGTAAIDFVCNFERTEDKLAGVIPEGTENVVVVACGLGVQTVADFCEKPVFTATNSLNYIGYHGMSLTQKTCGACAQCYLNITGGICPIVDCSKSLVNGQCGGAKDGKCEVDPEKPCAWEKINAKLSAMGSIQEFLDQPVQLRDYSKAGIKEIKEYVAAIRDSHFDGYKGGVHPIENKEYTEGIALKQFPAPKEVVIPMSMHAGAPANPIVAVGDYVKLGQKIGEAAGFISANVHSSVSGTVKAIEAHRHPNGAMVNSIIIESDGKDVLDDSIKPAKALEELTAQEIVDIVKEKGITGMGGAGFPTYVKLMPNKPIDTVLLNGSECEPYLTADHRVLLEYADEVIFGLKAIMKAVNAPKGIIVIEDNKPDAVELMTQKLEGIENLEVLVARTKYPEGAEKMLIKKALKRMVPSGGLPADVGVVVSNISSAKAISDAIQKGMPLVERVLTATGEHIANPGNFIVKIGTNVKDIIDYCGGIVGEDVTIKLGGPMMGMLCQDTNVPVIKGSNGIIAIDTDHSVAVDCIKCGRCVDVCPMGLVPLWFARYSDDGNAQALKDNNIMDCFECRSCEYICSSKIKLVDKIKAGKLLVRGMK